MNFKIRAGRRGLLLIIIVIFGMNSFAQIALGEWRTHLPYQFSTIVMVTEDKAFCSSTGGFFYTDLNDNTIQTLSKTDGLSDNGLSAMRWSEEDQMAVLAYENANVDIIIGNDILNIPDIMKKQIPGNKTINHIYFLNKKAYLSCGFGIVVLDLVKFEITETYYIGDNGTQLQINQLSSDGTYFYAATEKGIKMAAISNPFLIDFNSWKTIETLPFPNSPYSGVEYFNGRLFAVYNEQAEQKDKLYYYDGLWKEYTLYNDERCYEIKQEGEYLILVGEDGVQIMSEDFIFIKNYLEGNPRSATLDSDGVLWIADYGRGLVKVEANTPTLIKPNGPWSAIAYKMAQSNGILYSVSGGVNAIYNNVYRPGILMDFRDELWKSNIKYDFNDLISLVVDPEDPNHVFAASWGHGLVEYIDGKPVEVYNETNSSLQDAVPGKSVVRIGGLAYDQEDNLWMTNTAVSEPISVLKSDGSWKSFKAKGLLSSYPALGEILISESGNLWGIIPKGGGLFAINFNGTIDNEEDDEYKLVSVVDENGKVITNEIFSMAEDQNGNIWLGTNQGILVYYNPESLFTDGSVHAQDICIPRDDGTEYCDPLLETEKITSIEVDGANRKWLGTADGGAFLVSETGINQVYYFNTTNSPLLSNSILDICVEGESGEVFFGTEKGIISFRGESTAGKANYSDVKVYPNPVREDYYGPIAIKGLLAETTVKITDISGNLVQEIESFGGQAVWDGTDFNGRRVSTGVYLIFMSTGDPYAPAAAVSKVLFIH
ncbi:MAG: hypothetical protein PF450_15915 [Bacteroidales bacterium]|jgi:hypothetical protein|nr:hypothetical protein [Bacteroidales bacterium]